MAKSTLFMLFAVVLVVNLMVATLVVGDDTTTAAATTTTAASSAESTSQATAEDLYVIGWGKRKRRSTMDTLRRKKWWSVRFWPTTKSMSMELPFKYFSMSISYIWSHATWYKYNRETNIKSVVKSNVIVIGLQINAKSAQFQKKLKSFKM